MTKRMVLTAALMAAWTAQAGDPSYAPDFYQVVAETYHFMEGGQDPLIEHGVSDEDRELFHDAAEKIVAEGRETARRHLDTLCHSTARRRRSSTSSRRERMN